VVRQLTVYLCLGSLAVVVLGGLVQVSFGAFSMTLIQAWQAVFNPDVVLNAQT
jgi:iron complex transport system permease protein